MPLKTFPKLLTLFFCFLLMGAKTYNSNTPDVKIIIDNMVAKSKAIKTIELDMLMTERIDGKQQKSKSFFKIAYSPFRIYMKQDYPMKGLEIMYIEGDNNNKAKVKPSTFPRKTVSLDPFSNLMRQDFHHSIFKSGYAFIVGVMEHLEAKYKDGYSKLLKHEGLVKYDGNICYKINYTNPYFKQSSYTVKNGEKLEDISKKLMVSDYMIKELNPKLRSFTKITAGTKLKVPNDYGKTITLYIDKSSYLLMGIKVYDDKGLWEEYTYRNVKTNLNFTTKDFSTSNPSYGF